MRTYTYFDPDRDISAVQPNMSIRLNKSLEDLVIKDTGVEVYHNGIDNPNSVIGRCRNTFDVIDMQRGSLNFIASNTSNSANVETQTE